MLAHEGARKELDKAVFAATRPSRYGARGVDVCDVGVVTPRE